MGEFVRFNFLVGGVTFIGKLQAEPHADYDTGFRADCRGQYAYQLQPLGIPEPLVKDEEVRGAISGLAACLVHQVEDTNLAEP